MWWQLLAGRDLEQLKWDEKASTEIFLAVSRSLEYITEVTDVAKAISSTCGILVMNYLCVCKRLWNVQKEVIVDCVCLQAEMSSVVTREREVKKLNRVQVEWWTSIQDELLQVETERKVSEMASKDWCMIERRRDMPIGHKGRLKSDDGICKNKLRRGEDTSLEPSCKDS